MLGLRLWMEKVKGAFLGLFGHVNVDYITDATRDPPIEEGPFFGGVAGNIAVGASRFGVPIRLASVVGRNFPASYLKLLKDLKVDLRFLQIDKDKDTSKCTLVNLPNGKQRKEIFHGPQTDSVRIPPEFADNIKHLHVSTGLPHACIWMLKVGRSKRCTVAFDPGADLARHYEKEHLAEALSYSDIFFVNEEELEVALGLLGGRTYKTLLKHVGTLIMTRAERGSVLVEGGKEIEIPAVEVKDVVDPTGAGDAYRSGLYAGLFRGHPMKVCCMLGAIAASEAIRSEGAQGGLKSWRELARRLNRFA